MEELLAFISSYISNQMNNKTVDRIKRDVLRGADVPEASKVTPYDNMRLENLFALYKINKYEELNKIDGETAAHLRTLLEEKDNLWTQMGPLLIDPSKRREYEETSIRYMNVEAELKEYHLLGSTINIQAMLDASIEKEELPGIKME